ncbi:MAG: DUF3987 domain-containing protein [Pseudomonadota bacterium]
MSRQIVFDTEKITEKISKAMELKGFAVSLPVIDGKWHRFAIGDKRGDKNGSYIFYSDGIPAGFFCNWVTGESCTWSAKSELDMTEHELTAFREQMAAAKVERDRLQAEAYRAAAVKARQIWEASKPVTHHPYLTKKQVVSIGLRIGVDGRLIVPVYGADGIIQSLQFISDDGEKKNLTGGKMSGGWCFLDGDPHRVAIVEGCATGDSIRQATGYMVYIGFTAGNLLSVSRIVRARHPDAKIVICCDNDQWTKDNPGLNKGREAAESIGADVVVPIFKDMSTKPTDFNDLMVIEGVEAVKRQITKAIDISTEVETIRDPERWPVLESDAIYGENFLKPFIDIATENSEADPAAVLMTFLSRFAIEVGGNPHMWIGDGRQHVNILTSIVGATGSGRKGTSEKPVGRLFKIVSKDYVPATTTPGPLSSGEGIIYAVRDAVREWKVDKKSSTGEWIVVDPGVQDKRLFVLSEELASAFKVMQREGNILSTVVRQLYDSGNLAPLIKNNKTTATGAHVGIVGHITIYELEKLLEQNEIHNGLINRFMWVCSRRQKVIPFPKPIPDDSLKAMQQDLRKIIEHAHTVKEMVFSDKSKLLWEREYPNLTKDHGGIMGTILARAVNHVIRLSMLHALLDMSDVIEPCHIEAALSIWRYCEQSARYIFESQTTGDPLQCKILDAIKAGPKTATDLYKHFKHHVTSAKIRAAIKELMAQNKVDSTLEKGPGPPKTTYFLK